MGAMSERKTETAANPPAEPPTAKPPIEGEPPAAGPRKPREIGGPSGPEPTRYGDWERKGRCSDF